MRLGMTDYAKLTERLMGELKVTQTELGKRLGVSQSAVSRWLKGGKVEVENRDRLDDFSAKVFGTAKRRSSAGVPLVGYAAAGESEVDFGAGAGQGPFGYAKAPSGATEKTVCVQIRGTSLGAFLDGWLVYYDDYQEPPHEGLTGRLCVVGLVKGKVYVKQLVISKTRQRWHLFSNAGQPPMLDVEVEWAAPVFAMASPVDLLP